MGKQMLAYCVSGFVIPSGKEQEVLTRVFDYLGYSLEKTNRREWRAVPKTESLVTETIEYPDGFDEMDLPGTSYSVLHTQDCWSNTWDHYTITIHQARMAGGQGCYNADTSRVQASPSEREALEGLLMGAGLSPSEIAEGMGTHFLLLYG